MRDNFRGCLVGTALGDAVGFMVEKQTPEKCLEYIKNEYLTGEIVNYTRTHRSGKLQMSYSFGRYSDDTQLTRELMISLAIQGGWKPEDFAKRIADMFAKNKIVGAGRASKAAAARLINGAAWNEAGEKPPVAGNGTAMRASPVGLFFRTDYQEIIRISQEQSIITHADPRAQSGAALVALAVALALNERDVIDTPAQFLDRLMLLAAADVDPLTCEGLIVLADNLNAPFNEAVANIAALDTERKPEEWMWISPYVTTTVMWALWAFLNNMDNYEAAITAAIIAGGDTDTVAAITSSISGTYLGLNAIPKRYLHLLNDNGEYKYNDLIHIADMLYDVSTSV